MKNLLWIFSLFNSVKTVAWFLLLSCPDPNILVTNLYWLVNLNDLSQKNQESISKVKPAVSYLHFTSGSVPPATYKGTAQILKAVDVYQILVTDLILYCCLSLVRITLFFSLLFLKSFSLNQCRVVGFWLAHVAVSVVRKKTYIIRIVQVMEMNC